MASQRNKCGVAADVWGRCGTFSRDFRNGLGGGFVRRRPACSLSAQVAGRAKIQFNRGIDKANSARRGTSTELFCATTGPLLLINELKLGADVSLPGQYE